MEKKNGNPLEGLIIALSMYSKIPMPRMEWTESGMKYAIGFFPLIGVIIGGLMVGLKQLSQFLQLNLVVVTCLGTALPLLVTGGIHMDGFLDTTDARSSYEGKERKLEILKDPHAGAFAILWCGIYLLLYAAAVSQLGAKAYPAVAGIYVITRVFSGWSVITFPKAKEDGLAYTFASAAQKKTVEGMLRVWAVGSVIFWYYTAGFLTTLCLTVAAGLVFIWYRRMCLREFGGMTGDLAGYFLQTAELVLMAVLAGMTGVNL